MNTFYVAHESKLMRPKTQISSWNSILNEYFFHQYWPIYYLQSCIWNLRFNFNNGLLINNLFRKFSQSEEPQINYYYFASNLLCAVVYCQYRFGWRLLTTWRVVLTKFCFATICSSVYHLKDWKLKLLFFKISWKLKQVLLLCTPMHHILLDLKLLTC